MDRESRHHYLAERVVTERLVGWQRRPINDQVDKAHAECRALGGCRYGDAVISRPSRALQSYVALRVCQRCQVPESPPAHALRNRKRVGLPALDDPDEDVAVVA